MRLTEHRLGLSTIVVIAAIAFIICSCQPASPSPTPLPTATTTPEPQKISLQLGGWGTATERLNTVLEQFNQQHPNITVQFAPTTSGEYDSVLLAQLEAGTAPDIFYLRSFSGSTSLYEAGYLDLLNDITGLEDNFSPAVRSAWATEDGDPYGVPFTATSHGIYYNESIFEELGLPVPETWEALIETAAAIQEAGYVPFANSSKDDWTLAEIIFMNIAPSFVGGLEGRMAYLQGERCFDDNHIVATFAAVEQMAPYLPANHELLGYVDSLEMFVQGQAAMWMSGSWDIPYFENAAPDFVWSVFPVPAPTGQPTYITFHLDLGIGLNAECAHKEEAKRFLAWLGTGEFAKLLGDEMPGFFPVHKDVPALNNEHANAFLQLNNTYGTDIRFSWEELGDGTPTAYSLILQGTRGILNGTQTPQEAADQLQSGLAEWYTPAQSCNE
jgi:raffinose/stachyose/melibiose transport system substrate-binding protein